MDTDTWNGSPNRSSSEEDVTGKLIVMGIILVPFAFVFFIFPKLYAIWFWWQLNFAPDQDPIASGLRKGLDPSILRSLPVLSFNREEFEEGLECAVCLSEVEDGEKTRLLPECNHGFHVQCIDMWFHSHSTCPLCRNQVSQQNSNSPTTTMGDSEQQLVESNCPTGSSSTPDDGMLIIDIPQHMTENLSEEELDSPMASCVEAEQVDRKEPEFMT